MQGSFEMENKDIMQTIDLTSKLQESLRKLITKKKSLQTDYFSVESQHNDKNQSLLIAKIQTLQQSNKELSFDNQQLSKEILSLRDQLRECKKELESSKKWGQFIQSYNEDLKKQLLFWTKGRKKVNFTQEPSSSQLFDKIQALRKENENNEAKLLGISQHVRMKTESMLSYSTKKYPQLQYDFFKPKSASKESKRVKNSKNMKPDCTSCNYIGKVKSKSIHMINSKQKKSEQNKSKNLRKWHNNYISQCLY